MDDEVSPPFSALRATWLSLAVNAQRGRRQRTNVNLNGLLRTTSRGFEDRWAGIHNHPLTSAQIRFAGHWIRSYPQSVAVVHEFGCHGRSEYRLLTTSGTSRRDSEADASSPEVSSRRRSRTRSFGRASHRCPPEIGCAQPSWNHRVGPPRCVDDGFNIPNV